MIFMVFDDERRARLIVLDISYNVCIEEYILYTTCTIYLYVV